MSDSVRKESYELTGPAQISLRLELFLSTALDGSTTFEAWDHGALIQGFTRSATGAGGGDHRVAPRAPGELRIRPAPNILREA